MSRKWSLVTLSISVVITLCLFMTLPAVATDEHQMTAAPEAGPPPTPTPSHDMEMKKGDDPAGDPEKMSMSDQNTMGMMDMMMSHMMKKPGGMGKMMGQMGSGMMGGGKGPCDMKRMAHMLDNLNLTPEQWDKVHPVAQGLLYKVIDLWAQRMKLQVELAGLRTDQNIDANHVKSLFVKEAEARADIFLAGMDYLRELRAILTPDQLQQLDGQGH